MKIVKEISMTDFTTERNITTNRIAQSIIDMSESGVESDDVLNYLYFVKDDISGMIKKIRAKQRRELKKKQQAALKLGEEIRQKLAEKEAK